MSEADVAPPRDLYSDVDDLFDALSNRRRRYVLSYLQNLDDDAAELSELTAGVLARGTGRTDDRGDEVATTLHHVHLPKLAKCGLVDYDSRSGTVRYSRHPDREHRVALAFELAGDRS